MLILCVGCPVAWLISNREDEVTLGMFFKVIKERCPKAKVKTLMTDDGKSLFTHDHIVLVCSSKDKI